MFRAPWSDPLPRTWWSEPGAEPRGPVVSSVGADTPASGAAGTPGVCRWPRPGASSDPAPRPAAAQRAPSRTLVSGSVCPLLRSASGSHRSCPGRFHNLPTGTKVASRLPRPCAITMKQSNTWERTLRGGASGSPEARLTDYCLCRLRVLGRVSSHGLGFNLGGSRPSKVPFHIRLVLLFTPPSPASSRIFSPLLGPSHLSLFITVLAVSPTHGGGGGAGKEALVAAAAWPAEPTPSLSRCCAPF